ncbi:AMP-binding protein [Streptomyces sp. NBC_01537]|uniref:AMP-binding protein n=1 Tax=Streptomyces sp. NBC_01537 TaxID=2903896 RepID=UPI00386988BF
MGRLPEYAVLTAGAAEGGCGPSTAPGDLAYGMYTFGSAGRPKGVAISHRSLAHTLVVPTDDLTESVPHLTAACERLRITVLALPTAYWHAGFVGAHLLAELLATTDAGIVWPVRAASPADAGP